MKRKRQADIFANGETGFRRLQNFRDRWWRRGFVGREGSRTERDADESDELDGSVKQEHGFSRKWVQLNHLQTGQRAGAGAEAIGGDAGALEHGDIQIAQRRRAGADDGRGLLRIGFFDCGGDAFDVGLIEGQMLAVFESTAGQKHWKVGGRVRVAVLQVARDHDHRAIEHVATGAFFGALELGQHGSIRRKQIDFDLATGFEFLRFFSVMRKVVVVAKGFDRDRAGGVGDEREVDHVKHELQFLLLLAGAGDILGRRDGRLGLGAVDPVAGHLKLAFDVADGFKIFVEARAIGRGDALAEALGLVADEIEHAAAGADLAQFFLLLLRACWRGRVLRKSATDGRSRGC